MRIFLIGFMGSGKTTLGKPLAAHLECRFIDTDAWIESKHNCSISDIFANQGEAWFREEEHKILEEIAKVETAVISTGGGMPCFSNNMEIMRNMGYTIFLDIPIPILVDNITEAQANRPLVKHKSQTELEQFVQETLTLRRPYYEQAELIIKQPSPTWQNVYQLIVNR